MVEDFFYPLEAVDLQQQNEHDGVYYLNQSCDLCGWLLTAYSPLLKRHIRPCMLVDDLMIV